MKQYSRYSNQVKFELACILVFTVLFGLVVVDTFRTLSTTQAVVLELIKATQGVK